MKLFKLKSFSEKGLLYILDMIVNERIYLSTCDFMNDINEGDWDYTDPKDNKYIETAKKLRGIVDSQRFTSFLQSISHPLMWAHYAGGFSGVALEYDFDPSKQDIREIKYDGPPFISKEQMERVISGSLLPQDIGILKSKPPCWIYEGELRLYGKGQGKYIENIRPASIIFGVKPSNDSFVTREIARKFNIKVGYLNSVTELNYEIIYD